MAKSEEPYVSTWAIKQIEESGYQKAYEQHHLSKEIEQAFSKAKSKKGGNGNGRPDAQMLIECKNTEIPVFFEFKGSKSNLKKTNKNGLIDLFDDNDEIDYKNIEKYAVNGACYYSYVVLNDLDPYDKPYKNEFEENIVLSVGITGYRDSKHELLCETEIYLQTYTHKSTPIFLSKQSDLSLLTDKTKFDELLSLIEGKLLDSEELHKKEIADEQLVQERLKNLNEHMHSYHNIPVGKRIDIVASCIMAGLGVKDNKGDYVVEPLQPRELNSSLEEGNFDGNKILSKVKNFLKKRGLPEDKQKDIYNYLKFTLSDKNINDKAKSPSGNIDSHSALYYTYKMVKEDIIPLYDRTGKFDFTGTLFNVMNTWVDVPDGGKNDVVLTPRYITKLMAELCEINQDSYVWDWALGSGGFLISAMNLMIEDAIKNANSPKEREEKIAHIKSKQLLGIEKLQNVYILAVLNMILMDDGSSNIINMDSFEFNGTYPYGEEKNKEFPADVFLLNPPYSTKGNGMVFVEEAFKKMKKGGRGCVIIQDSAGSGQAKDININILKHNTLKASIKMPGDLFKASVQTSIYLFETGRPHKRQDIVQFVDFREDGYERNKRKKSSANLRDIGNAKSRYRELVDLLTINGYNDLEYLEENKTYIKDTIDPEDGTDWNFDYHVKKDLTPKEEDFINTIGDFFQYQVNLMIGGRHEQ